MGNDTKKKLNPKQAKFAQLYTGAMTRSDAYMTAYGTENRDDARRRACDLIRTNQYVKSEIDRILDVGLEEAVENLRAEANSTVTRMIELRDMGNKEYTVQLAACKDILDRIGLKPPEKIEHEHSGDITFKLLNVDLSGYPKKDDNGSDTV